MAVEYAPGKKTASAKLKVGIAAIVGICAFILTGLLASWPLAPLAGWDAAALVYSVWVWLTIWPLDEDATSKHAVREDPSRGASDIVVLIASVASLGAVALVLIEAGNSSGLPRLLQVALGVFSVVLSWAVVHTLFALRYAELFYTEPQGGVDFNDPSQPTYKDFAYLAFTLGMTFQVSDTVLKTRAFRSVALRHALISYMFGTVIVATTINLVAGLSK